MATGGGKQEDGQGDLTWSPGPDFGHWPVFDHSLSLELAVQCPTKWSIAVAASFPGSSYILSSLLFFLSHCFFEEVTYFLNSSLVHKTLVLSVKIIQRHRLQSLQKQCASIFSPLLSKPCFICKNNTKTQIANFAKALSFHLLPLFI